jgi:hypothetical protein
LFAAANTSTLLKTLTSKTSSSIPVSIKTW